MPVVSGSASSSRSKSSSTTKTTASRELDIAETLSRFDAGSKAQLDQLMLTLMDRVAAQPAQAKALEGVYGKEQAMADSQLAMRDAIQQTLQLEIPKILDMQNRAGAYSSTTAQLLADNAQAQAAQKGAAVQLQNIQNYSTILQNARETDIAQSGQDLEAVLSALQLQRDATQSSTRSEDESGESTSKTKSSGSSSSVSASATY